VEGTLERERKPEERNKDNGYLYFIISDYFLGWMAEKP
jgi:hypothetical protein